MNVMFDTADPAFDYHDEYYSINTGAHRKGGVELTTPTLTHHLGFWFPSQRSGELPQRTVERYGGIVDLHVMAIYRALCRLEDVDCNIEFLVDGERVLALFRGAYRVDADGSMSTVEVTDQPHHFALKDAIESDNRILFIKARWAGLAVIVRCEFHSEYFTLTRFATLVDAKAVPAEVEDLTAHLETLARLARAKPGDVARDQPTFNRCHAFIYQDFWDCLDRALFENGHLFARGTTEIRSRVFADFRGLVLAGNDTPPDGHLLTGPFASDKDRGRPFADDWPWKSLIPSIWPFLTAKEGLDLKRREFTASFMLGKRAVYITALGPQPPADGGLRCAPLSYFLVARPMSDWQLGSLLDRLHLMGSVRLAALMELQALRIAGATLRDLEQEAEKARSAIERNDHKQAFHHYRRVIALLAHKDVDHRPLFQAGLQFRVERSRYYVQRFADFVPFLGMSPVEGYQQYDHFVRSRLGGIYDYIDRLGHRQERAVAGAAAISQAILLKELAEANQQSAEANQQSAEANRQSAKANEQNSVISQTIAKLQTKAEIALLGVIVPHYVMDIIHGFEERWHDGYKMTVKWYIAIMLVAVMLSLASLGNYVLDRRRDGNHEVFTDTVVRYFFLFILSILITITVMAVVHF